MRRPRSGWPIIVTVADVVAAALQYRTIVIDSQDSAVDMVVNGSTRWLRQLPGVPARGGGRGRLSIDSSRMTLQLRWTRATPPHVFAATIAPGGAMGLSASR